jgi:hypothetical protein
MQQPGHFPGHALPESRAKRGRPVVHPETRSVLANRRQMERRTGETGGQFPFEQLFAAPIPGCDPVP